MSLRAFRTLQAIARHGSFARAGDAVGLTQSAVSLQVKNLEDEFGVLLFDRSRRLPALTEAGRIVLAKADEILALYDGIRDAISDEHALAGRLRLGAIQTALSGSLPTALAKLNRAHPRLRVHVHAGMSADLAARVAGGDLDAAITTVPVRPHPTGLVWTKLYADKFWLIAPANHAGQSMSELIAELPFLRFDARAWAGRMIAREMRRLGFRVRDEMILDSPQVILRMVDAGLGVAVVPLSEEALETYSVARMPFGRPQLTRGIVLLERRERASARFCAALANAIVESAGDQRGD